jgi:ssRNA-specific RNase YbeY (16S rRNA maturation enzyme)
MKNLNVFEIATSGWKEENFQLMTNLTEEQIRAVIKPMVDKEREDEVVLSNDEYIQALQDKYKNKIIVLYTDFELLEF